MNDEVPLQPVPARPVLTPEGLALLTDDVGRESARDFLNSYLRLLPSRTDDIVEKLAGGDVKGARKAVSSLYVTSSMAGALQLEDYCQHLQQQLSLGRIPIAEAVKAELSGNVSQLSPAIRLLLDEQTAGSE